MVIERHSFCAAAHTCATPRRCKDAQELKEKLTAWSLKVAEDEHHIKVNDAAKETFVVREMMPKDIKREFLTDPGNSMKSWKSWRSLSTK